MLRSRPKRGRLALCYDDGMTAALDMAAVATLVGDPARANMLTILLDGRAHTASELANAAGIAAPTASGHLGKLIDSALVSVVPQGRHRYFRLASDEVARMLEGIMTVAVRPEPAKTRATPRIAPDMRRARTCYDHIAGELGVAIADALVARGAVRLTNDSAEVTDAGHRLLGELGIDVGSARHTRRLTCRPCLDWSERRPHLAGVLGAAILDHALASGWVARRPDSRALTIVEASRSPLAALLGT